MTVCGAEVFPSRDAVILAVPSLSPVTIPPGDTIATASLSELQTTDELISSIELLLMIPLAVSCNSRFGENKYGPMMSIELACNSAAKAILLDSDKMWMPGVDNNIDESSNTDNNFDFTKMTSMSICVVVPFFQ
ncbi:hypothetical protein D3C76_908720 [compost metagenome]